VVATGIVATMDERAPDPDRPAAYPVPEATSAGDLTVLGAILAGIVGVLFFWRRKKQVGLSR
jgi:LPXTG-motif cell wall-anchored protein